eukprot:1148992-Pelagomonas_calceolata.AAC.4
MGPLAFLTNDGVLLVVNGLLSIADPQLVTLWGPANVFDDIPAGNGEGQKYPVNCFALQQA